jgi:crotonobetainyl-CoA:carnitine CoA-transferase CaiB-like acyl-CoA transferase
MEDHQVDHLWDTLGRLDIPANALFASHALRAENADKLRAEIQRTLLERPAAEWEAMLNRAGVPAGRTRGLPEALADPTLNPGKLIRVFEQVDGVEGPVSVPMVPFGLSESTAGTDLPPPRLGAHTREILGKIGYSDADMEGMERRRII